MANTVWNDMSLASFDMELADVSSIMLKHEDGIDSGICTPEALSPGSMPFFDFGELNHDIADETDLHQLLKPLSASDLFANTFGVHPTLGDIHLDEVCAQLDLGNADDFIGLQLDEKAMADFMNIVPLADIDLQLTSTLSSTSLVGSNSCIDPALFSSMLRGTHDDDEDEIDIETVDEPSLAGTPVVLKESMSLDSFTLVSSSMPIVPLLSLPTSSASSTASSTPVTSRSASPNKGNSSSRMHPYGTPAHTPKRNTERKRKLHNELERRRREDLNLIFNQLGDAIQSLRPSANRGAPTQTQILQGATQQLKDLRTARVEMSIERQTALAEQARLQARLAELRRSA